MRFLSLLIATSLYAQQPAATTKPARLEGKALHANTGEPLRKVNVTITQTGGRGGIARQISTESDGSFIFDSLPAGNFQLSAERNGFLPQRYASSRAQGASTVVLASGQTLTGIDFKLMPQGAVSGRIQDADGEPMQRVQVSILKVTSLGGRRKATVQNTVSTNDLGEFRIFNLPAGRYFVMAVAPASSGGRGGGGFGGGPPRQQVLKLATDDFVPTYFPGSIDASGAALIDLQPGREVSGLYFQMKRSPTFRIRGNVSGVQLPTEQVKRGPGFRVMLMNADKNAVTVSGGMSNSASVRADGIFEFNNIQPGQYVAVLSRFDRQQPVTLGKTPVSVSSGHIDNLSLIANEPVALTGAVKVDGQAPADLSSIGLYLQSAESGPGSSIEVTLDQKGIFKVDAASRDMFTLTTTGTDAFYVQSVRVGSLDATELGIDLSSAASTSTIEVTLGSKPGNVLGKVMEGDKPAVGRIVTLLPDPARPLQPYLTKRATTAEDGSFTVKGVAPGNYKVFAWEEITSDLYRDAEFMRRFDNDGSKVVVKEGSSERVELPLMKVDK